MSETEDLERRVGQLERRLDETLTNRMVKTASAEPEKPVRRGPTRTSRVFWGLFVLLVGLIWLGQNFEIEWLNNLKFWPVAVIVFGVYLIFGDRGR
jgi:hypothetical protein